MQSTITKLSTAVAYTTLACTDLAQAERYYRDTLGFDVEMMKDVPDTLMVHCGAGTGIGVYKRPSMPHCDATALNFVVDDLEATMADLRSHGVVFEDYDLPYLKTVNGIAMQGPTKAAWFKDPAGNILSVVQM